MHAVSPVYLHPHTVHEFELGQPVYSPYARPHAHVHPQAHPQAHQPPAGLAAAAAAYPEGYPPVPYGQPVEVQEETPVATVDEDEGQLEEVKVDDAQAEEVEEVAVTPPTQAKRDVSVEGPEPNCNLFVFNIPSEWGDVKLADAFKGFGSIVSSKVFIDHSTGKSKGFGFVSFDNPRSASDAIQGMNGVEVEPNKIIKVSLKTPSSSRRGSSEQTNTPKTPSRTVSRTITTESLTPQGDEAQTPTSTRSVSPKDT
mmetsp:Transcript_18772/g.46113  ORF Transcript_18772/g.46113 Transcript_18772/m.46113 type:complete len:255 (-) Transcript_18772:200-964(-)